MPSFGCGSPSKEGFGEGAWIASRAFAEQKGMCYNIALWVSLYWEGDLRNLSYFLNKRKELEFNN